MPSRPLTTDDLDQIKQMLRSLVEARQQDSSHAALTTPEIKSLLEIPNRQLELEKRIDTMKGRVDDLVYQIHILQVAISGEGEKQGIVSKLAAIPADATTKLASIPLDLAVKLAAIPPDLPVRLAAIPPDLQSRLNDVPNDLKVRFDAVERDARRLQNFVGALVLSVIALVFEWLKRAIG